MKTRSKSKSKRSFNAKALMSRMKKSKASIRGGKSIIDIEKIGDRSIWKPKDGDHTIDVIPYFAGPDDPKVEEGSPTYLFSYAVHFNIGAAEEPVVCPAVTYGKPCPICEHRIQMREKGAEKDKWKKLFPKDRAVYNIVCYDRGEEEKGVQIWDVSNFYFENPVVKLATRKGRGGKTKEIIFQDPKNGKSIVFEIEPAKSKDDYPSYSGLAFEDRDYEIEDDILEQALPLDQVVSLYTYDEIDELYWAGVKSKKRGKGKDEEEEEENEQEEPSTDELMEELEECEDLDDLQVFIEGYDIDVEITKKSKFGPTKSKVKKAILTMTEDEPEDEEEEDEPEDEEEEDEMRPTWGEIKKMKSKDLQKLIDEEDLDIDLDDYDGLTEKREAVADDLDIEY